MSSGAAVPFWRAAGMTYISYSNICANLLRNCLKEPFKSEALAREKVHFSVAKWVDGKPQKPTKAVIGRACESETLEDWITIRPQSMPFGLIHQKLEMGGLVFSA